MEIWLIKHITRRFFLGLLCIYSMILGLSKRCDYRNSVTGVCHLQAFNHRVIVITAISSTGQPPKNHTISTLRNHMIIPMPPRRNPEKYRWNITSICSNSPALYFVIHHAPVFWFYLCSSLCTSLFQSDSFEMFNNFVITIYKYAYVVSPINRVLVSYRHQSIYRGCLRILRIYYIH